MATPTVFITVPKYVAITPLQAAQAITTNSSGATTIVTPITTSTTTTTTVLPKLKPAPPPQNSTSIVTNISNVSDIECSDSNCSTTATPPRGKKRRLDHLTWEEKIQRKKLKNRVAAQTSRDRKKARMEEMESEIKELTARTQILVNKCESLQAINDSLLEKNQKLDMEVETLRQQLQELQNKQQQQDQQQQRTMVSTCAGCESLLTGSAVSKNTDPLQQGSNPKDFQSTQALNKLQQQLKKSTTVSSLWRVIALCLLYKICSYDIEIGEGTLDDAEFDAGKLEELAESLLADITADLEASDRESDASTAEITGGTERLLGSVVGTTTECLESSKHTGQNGSGLNPQQQEVTTATTTTSSYMLPSLQTPELTLESKLETENCQVVSPTTSTATTSTPAITNTLTAPEATAPSSIPPDTVYGTYDAKTNSITVVMDDVAVPVNEVVEEIYWDSGANGSNASSNNGDNDDDVDMIYTSTSASCSPSGIASPSQVFLNVTSCSDDELDDQENTKDTDNDDDEFNFDPIAKFLCPKRPLVSPLAKSPASSFHSATSDHGYESILGSPPSSLHYEPLSEDLPHEFNDWPPGFSDLFPSLI
ncbi:LOW QUALITY PROTEIN: X box binding protein 1 [Musca autumnalis]|uniref:LOW QUALITY PROTEIN: X box binding protein 1 n=1 Tax=Musca autumnalis TaxID=221902 RepID=UPI003CF5357B